MTKTPTSFSLAPKAARAFIALTDDRKEIVGFLSSADEGSRWAAAKGLKGKPLDTHAVGRLGKQLESELYGIHIDVASTLAADPTPTTAREKIVVLLEATSKVKRLANVDPSAYASIWLIGEYVTRRYVGALAAVKGVSRSCGSGLDLQTNANGD